MYQLSGVKTIIINDSTPLKKQEGIIVDKTGHVKIILWAEHTGQLEKDKTYIFTNLRLKQSGGVKYLNTPKDSTGISIEETQPFTDLFVSYGVNRLDCHKRGSSNSTGNTAHKQVTHLFFL